MNVIIFTHEEDKIKEIKQKIINNEKLQLLGPCKVTPEGRYFWFSQKDIIIDIRLYNDDELMHYGVLGMKWGVRRYQNKDGSLTPVGKKVSNDSKMYKHKYEKASNAIKDYYDDLHKQNSYINPSTGN